MKQGEYGDRPFWLLIFEIAGLMRERAVQLGSAAETETFLELTISQQRILRHVRQLTRWEREGVTLKALADAAGLSSGTASAQVEALVRKRLLERRPSPEDRRAVRIRLSEYGAEKFRNGHAYFTKLSELFFDRFPDADRQMLEKNLSDFYQYIETVSKEEK